MLVRFMIARPDRPNNHLELPLIPQITRLGGSRRICDHIISYLYGFVRI